MQQLFQNEGEDLEFCITQRLSMVGLAFSERILLVDDEPFNLMGLLAVMNKAAKALGLKENALDEIIDRAQDG